MDKNSQVFEKLDSIKYAGKCVGIVDGKITMTSEDPNKVVEKLKTIKDKEIGIVCFPSTKNAMAI